MLTDLWYYCDKRLGVVACLLPESSRRLLLFDVMFPVCPVDRRRVVPAMTLQSWCRWFWSTCVSRSLRVSTRVACCRLDAVMTRR
ncbi:hypothetical protein F2Q70_00023314 [Brassica cretica]|uniref:Uncharacterized protein n=1 Tax=Brassica cretica TaxID=69181 RepID=A0A8S9GJJ5_BRACR|nr:hypothetical protein F2Q70_00023314 [Brassica cretica]